MSLDELVRLVGTTGFPIAVTAYLLLRLDRTLLELRDEIRALPGRIRDREVGGE